MDPPKECFRISLWFVLWLLAIIPMIRGYFTFGLYAFGSSLVFQTVMVPRYVCLRFTIGFKNLYGPQACLTGNVCGGIVVDMESSLKHVSASPSGLSCECRLLSK
jgi:hypothetical protein